MFILIACEESQAACTAFRAVGHDAFSCDILPTSGRHPEWHIQGDVLPLLNGRCSFTTADGAKHHIGTRWDMIVAFPPCTDLAVSGARHFEGKRLDGRQRASIDFFCQFLYADCPKIAIENPVGIISGEYIGKHFPELAARYSLPRKPSQIIQPWQYGHGETKATCLWLKGLPCLTPTNVVEGRCGRVWRLPPSADRAMLRSKTYPGIAAAMASQWGGCVG